MIESLYDKFLNANGVTTDSRHVPKSSIFFALKGPNFNANKFAEEALDKGAAFVVIDDPAYQKGDQYLLVDDALKTLQQLGNYHRKNLRIPFLAITGSNGKTTTKELINAVLSQSYKTFATQGNLNNHIGVPLTLLSITKKVEIAIIEMGANKVGDINQLCQIAEPTHGLITNIGKAHIEGFGGFEGVIRGKSELYHYLIEQDGRIFVNSKNEILKNMSKRMRNPVFYPSEGDFFECQLLKADPQVVYQHENGEVFETNLIGEYNFENIATALCIGKYFNVPSEKANEAVKAYVPKNNRSEIHKKNSNTILMDAYNANPSSMIAALETFKKMKVNNKVVVLGDMLELGDIKEEEHRRIGEIVSNMDFMETILCGELMKHASDAFPAATYFAKKSDLIHYLKNKDFQNAYFLIKASRGMALEDIVACLK